MDRASFTSLILRGTAVIHRFGFISEDIKEGGYRNFNRVLLIQIIERDISFKIDMQEFGFVKLWIEKLSL